MMRFRTTVAVLVGLLSLGAWAQEPVVDTVPPGAPTGLVAAAEAGGVIRLSWTAPRDPDLVTYQVRRGIEGVRAPVPLPYVRAQGGAGTYLDRVDPRSRFAYTYTVVALDAAGNESPAAGPVRVAVPDIRPPRPPVLTGLTPRAKGVEVAWGLPDEPDLAGVYVYRSGVGESGSGARVTDQPIPLDETRFLDGEVNAGEVYAYRVTVVDGSGNESEPSPARQVRALGGKEVGNGPAR